MKINAKSRYAVTALTALAHHGAYLRIGACGQADTKVNLAPLSLAEIAQSHDISLSFLEQMFRDLKNAGLVQSLRGVKGGYVLTKSPELLQLSDIFTALGEGPQTTACGQMENCQRNDTGFSKCATHDLWAALEDHIDGFLQRVSLAHVMRGEFGLQNVKVPA